MTEDVLPTLPTLAVVVAKLSDDANGAKDNPCTGLDWVDMTPVAGAPGCALLDSFELDEVVPPTDGDSESFDLTFSNMEESKPRLTSGAAVAPLPGCDLVLLHPNIFDSFLDVGIA